jgi:FMN phosphatase YigB (HAD superfamily)
LKTEQGIVFDLFETLIDVSDFKPKGVERTDSAAETLGVDKKKLSKYWQDVSTVRNTNSSTSVILQLLNTFLRKEGIKQLPEKSKKFQEALEELGTYHDQAILNPRSEIRLDLKSLAKRSTIALLTNCDPREGKEWENSPIANLFKVCCFSCSMGSEKPCRETYETVSKELRLLPSKLISVGDGTDQEFEGARAAGFGRVVFMKGFVSQNGTRKKDDIEKLEKISDDCIDSLSELR